VLSASRGKIDYYLLPLYPAVSLLVGRWLAAVPWGRADRIAARMALAAAAVGPLALAAALLDRLPEPWLPGVPARLALLAVAGAAAVAAALAVRRPEPRALAATLAGSAGALWLVLVGAFLPAFAEAQPNAAVVADVRRELLYRPDSSLVLCADPARLQRDVLFGARTAVDESCELWPLVGDLKVPRLFLLRPAEFESFRRAPNFREVARYRFLPATALTLRGLLGRPGPAEMVLAANYGTADPVAERKRRRAQRLLMKRDLALLWALELGRDKPDPQAEGPVPPP
jgi:hypothetical protein